MITTANYILVAHLADGNYVFNYESCDVWTALGEFWHDDWQDCLSGKPDDQNFTIDVYAMDGAKVINTYNLVFNESYFHHYYDHGHCTLDEFEKAIREMRKEMDAEKKYDNKATSLFFYMWNCWCEEECKKAFADGDYNHFWKKWCGITEEHGRFGSVEHFYAELSNNNRDKLVRRACEMFDGSCEKY